MKDWKNEMAKILKEAMMNKDTVRSGVLKMLKTDLANEEIKNDRKDLTEEQVMALRAISTDALEKFAHQLSQSIEKSQKEHRGTNDT